MVEKNKRIRELRGKLGLSQRAFADRIGYTSGTIGSIEIGRTPVERRLVVVISSVFHVSEKWLLEGEGEIFLPKQDYGEKTEREIAEEYIITKIQALPDDLRMEVVNFCARLVAAGTSSEPQKKQKASESAADSGKSRS